MESLGKRHYLQSQDPSQYLNSSQEKKTAGMMAGDQERMYAQIGTLDTTLQPNQIFYNAQYDIDTMGKVPRKFQRLLCYNCEKALVIHGATALPVKHACLAFFIIVDSLTF